jgi:antitoxin component YwqK of YwqJK toxin-antitoxin module
MRGLILAALGAAACGTADAGGGGANKPYVPKVPPSVDAQPMVDASTAAVDTTTPAADWWKQGAKACPNGGSLQGDPPPKGTHVVCVRADGMNDGPEAWWDDKGHLLQVSGEKEGRQHGGFLAFYADGKKHRAGAYRAGNEAGTLTTWWPNGKVQLDEHFVDGRADGAQTAYTQDGKVVETWTLKMGTGTMKYWDDDGHKKEETAYVDGRANGPSVSYYPSGKVQTREAFVDGDADGDETDYYENGQIREKGTYHRGTQIGDWATYDDKGAQTGLTRRDGQGDELFEILYDGGQPLVPLPAPGPCDDKAGVEKVAFGHVHTGDEPECVERPRHFPGIAVAGSFAYDAGCLDPTWVVDCKKVSDPPDSKAVLARAGWAKAKGKVREALASAYVDEIAMMWDGSTMEEPDPRKIVSNTDGSVVVTAWTAPRSGMRYDPTITKVAWTFTKDGAVSVKTVGTGKRK